MIQRHRTGQAAPVVLPVGIVLDLLICNDLADIQPRLLGQFHGLLAGQLVTGVVQGQQQYAVSLVRQLHGLEYELSVGRGKNVAHSLHIQHAPAHKAGLGRLVAGAAVGDDGHPVGRGQILADDQMAFYVHNVGVCHAKADQLFVGDGLGGIDKFFHFHLTYLP